MPAGARRAERRRVAERAHRCAGEYLSAARAADRQYSAPGTNPILDRLRSFGQTRGLAFGAYGEASPDVHALLTVAADGLAARQWRDMGARTQEEARSFIVSSLRRRLGLVICREFARHRIRRVPYIGVPRAVVERGACSAASSSEDRRRECRSTCRTPTSPSTRPTRDGWPAARKRARTPRVPQGGRGARAPQRRSYTAY